MSEFLLTTNCTGSHYPWWLTDYFQTQLGYMILRFLRLIIFSLLYLSFPLLHPHHHHQFIITLIITASWSCNGPLLSGILSITTLISTQNAYWLTPGDLFCCWRKWGSFLWAGAGHSRVLNTLNLNSQCLRAHPFAKGSFHDWPILTVKRFFS